MSDSIPKINDFRELEAMFKRTINIDIPISKSHRDDVKEMYRKLNIKFMAEAKSITPSNKTMNTPFDL